MKDMEHASPPYLSRVGGLDLGLGFKVTLFIFLTLVVFLILFSGSLLAGVSAVVSEKSTVTGPRISLGDISELTADSEEDNGLLETLKKIDLGQSPSPGVSLSLRRSQLEARLISSGGPVNDARWFIPETVNILGGGRELSEDYIRGIIKEYLDRSEPYVSGRYDIISLRSPQPPALPSEGTVEYKFVPQPSSNPAYLAGTVFFTVKGKEVARLRVTVQVELELPALVAVRDLSRGRVLSEEDLSESFVSFSRAKGALSSVPQAVGQTLKLGIRAGDPVRDRDLVQTSMVNKGETVTIIAQSGSLKVTALGQAKENGALGQTITVINQDSKKTISAKVIGPGQVEVVF
jgi:flagella basal body P-ring formation protein FlgA